MAAAPSLQALLGHVSRSFSLSLRVLPKEVRDTIGVGYLLGRTADTLADTDVLPAELRKAHLLGLVSALGETGSPSLANALAPLLGRVSPPANSSMEVGTTTEAERELLLRIDETLDWYRRQPKGDQELLRVVVTQLVTGMVEDLGRFPAAGKVERGQVVALSTLAELDRYTYYAAGCVGEFWSKVCAAHLPQMAHLASPRNLELGVKLGKALQMVNVVRDAPADLRAGRCYLPEELLAKYGLDKRVLAEAAQVPRGELGEPTKHKLAALSQDVLLRTEALLQESWSYVQAIPKGALRLRLACAWPLLIGWDTTSLIRRQGSPLLQPELPIKIKRKRVYRILTGSFAEALLAATLPLRIAPHRQFPF